MHGVHVPEFVLRELAGKKYPPRAEAAVIARPMSEKIPWNTMPSVKRMCVLVSRSLRYVRGADQFRFAAGPAIDGRIAWESPTHELTMVTLRVVRHDRHEQVLAECQSAVLPARGEVIQLDTIDASGEMNRPSTLWRVVSVTVHVPSLASSPPIDGNGLRVQNVEVAVLPDIALVPAFEAAAAKILSESKL